MKTQIEELLDAGEELIDQIEGARTSVETQLSELGEAANDIESSVQELSRQADELHRQIASLRTRAPHLHDPVMLATTEAIDNLINLLTTAKTDFGNGEILSGIGALVSFDDHAQDLKAAFRLCKMAQRRQK